MEVNILKKMSLDTIGIGASLLCASTLCLTPLAAHGITIGGIACTGK